MVVLGMPAAAELGGAAVSALRRKKPAPVRIVYEFEVPMQFTLRGTMIVEAETADEAKDRAMAEPAYDAATCELVNWEVRGSARLSR
jgi:hypothetical protein